MNELPALNPGAVSQWVKGLKTLNIKEVGPAIQGLLHVLCDNEDISAIHRFEIMRKLDSTVHYLTNKIAGSLKPGVDYDRAVERLGSSISRAAASIYITAADGLADSRNPLSRRHASEAKEAALRYLGQEFLCSSLIYVAPAPGFWQQANGLLWGSLGSKRGDQRVRNAYTALALMSLGDPRRVPTADLRTAFAVLNQLPLHKVRYEGHSGQSVGCFVVKEDMPPGQGHVASGAVIMEMDGFFDAWPAHREPGTIIERTLRRRLAEPWAAKEQRKSRKATVTTVQARLGVSSIHAHLLDDGSETGGQDADAQQVVEVDDTKPMPSRFRVAPGTIELSVVDVGDGGVGVRCERWHSSLQVGEVVAVPWRNGEQRIGTVAWLSHDDEIAFGIEWLLADPQPVRIGGKGDAVLALLGRCRLGNKEALVFGSSNSANPRECEVIDAMGKARVGRTTVVRYTGIVRTLSVEWLKGTGSVVVDFDAVWDSLANQGVAA